MKRVYFLRPAGCEGPVKIGCTIDLPGRLRSAACWSPFELEVLATIEGGYDLEHQFHALFAADHERLEWFSWSSRMDETVAAINAGTFDPSALPEPEYIGLSKVMRRWAAEKAAPNHERAAA